MTMENKISLAGKEKILTINEKLKTWKHGNLSHKYDLTDKPEGVRSVNVSSDNKYLIITNESKAGKIRIVDLEKLSFLSPSYSGHSASVRLTSISRDNTTFFTGSWDGTARHFNIPSGKCSQVLSGLGRCPSVFLDEDERYLFTCSYDTDLDFESGNTGRCWDLSSRKVINFYRHSNERQELECMDIAYDQEYVYTGSDDGCSYRWTLEGDVPLLKYFECKGSVRKVAVSPKYFAAACTDGLVRVYQKLSGELVNIFKQDEPDIREIRITQNENRLFSGSADGSVSCYNLLSGELIYHRQIHTHWIWSMCLMNGDRVLVTGSRDGSIALLSTDTGKILAQLHNLPHKDDFLITCPPDKESGFPDGLFYTTNTDLIQVFRWDKEKGIQEKLEVNDQMRKAYFNKLNLKNLIITKLKNNGQYNSLTERYIQNRNLFNQSENHKFPQMLKTYKSGEQS
jgi:WD40 repeat protein